LKGVIARCPEFIGAEMGDVIDAQEKPETARLWRYGRAELTSHG